MKSVSLYISLMIFLIACKKENRKETADFEESTEVVISGEIEGSYWKEVQLKVVDVHNENYETYSFEPDSTENFNFKFNSQWPSSFTLSVGNNFYEGWFFPGDSVYLTGSLNKDNNRFIEELKISGDGAEKYKYFQHNALSDKNQIIEDKFLIAQKTPYFTFRSLMDTIYSLRLKRFKEDTAGLHLDQEFVQYELNRIRYTTLSEKVREPALRLYLHYDSTRVPDNYFSFLDQVNYQDSSFYNSIYYYRFLRYAFAELTNEKMPNYPIKDRLDAFTKAYFRMSDSLLQGKVKEYFETKIIMNYARVDINSFDSLILLLENKGYNNFLLQEHKKVNDSLRRISLSIDDSIQVFTKERKPQSLKKQLRNTDYTYLSVWNVGCKGCHLDFKNKAEIFDNYKDKIQFINICTDEPSEVVEKFIRKYGSTGHHYYDSDSDIVNHLNVRSYPRTFLFDKEGNLLELNFYRPGDPKLEDYFDKLINGSTSI